MQRILLTLASAKTLSYFEPSFQGYLLRQCHSLEGLKAHLLQTQQVLILAEFPRCTARHVEAFLSLKREVPISKTLQMQLIFFSQSIDFSVYQKFAREPHLLLIPEADRLKAPYLTGKFLQGEPVFMRSSPRQLMSSPVLIKSTNWISQENLPQRKGRFLDFATQGAKLYLPQRLFKPKDYISVLYQSQNQEWITVECQLRWESPTPDGGQMMGVQFLAIA